MYVKCLDRLFYIDESVLITSAADAPVFLMCLAFNPAFGAAGNKSIHSTHYNSESG